MKPPPVPRPRIGGGASGTTVPPWIWRSFGPRRAINCTHAERGVLALLEGFERDHHEGGIGLRIVVDEIQADDRRDVLDGVLFLQQGLGLADHFRCAYDRRAVGQLCDDEQSALVVLRQEAGRGDLCEAGDPERRHRDETNPITEKRTMRATAAP